ncbi:MAG: hypothetical protein ACLTKQ_08030 [Acutalibacteraceae bacterium]
MVLTSTAMAANMAVPAHDRRQRPFEAAGDGCSPTVATGVMVNSPSSAWKKPKKKHTLNDGMTAEK